MSVTISQVNEVRQLIEASFPEGDVQKLQFRPPMSKDGANVHHYGLWYGDQLLNLPVKEGYEPHTIDDISALTEAAVIGLEAHEMNIDARWTGQGHFVTIEPTREYVRSINVFGKDGQALSGHRFGESDEIFFKGYIDGTFGRPFTFSVGMWRKICANGAIAPIKGTKTEIKIRHTLQLRSRMNDLIETLSTASESFENIVARMRQYNERKVKIADFLSALYPAPEKNEGKAATQFRNTLEKIMNRLTREANRTGVAIEGSGLDQTASLWLLVNAVTGYVQHDKTRHGIVTPAQREFMAIDDPESIVAWQLADSMAG